MKLNVNSSFLHSVVVDFFFFTLLFLFFTIFLYFSKSTLNMYYFCKNS